MRYIIAILAVGLLSPAYADSLQFTFIGTVTSSGTGAVFAPVQTGDVITGSVNFDSSYVSTTPGTDSMSYGFVSEQILSLVIASRGVSFDESGPIAITITSEGNNGGFDEFSVTQDSAETGLSNSESGSYVAVFNALSPGGAMFADTSFPTSTNFLSQATGGFTGSVTAPDNTVMSFSISNVSAQNSSSSVPEPGAIGLAFAGLIALAARLLAIHRGQKLGVAPRLSEFVEQ